MGAAGVCAGSQSNEERFYPESRFGGFTDVDGTLAFYTRIRALVPSEGTVLDVGCGRGAYREDPIEIRRQARSLRGVAGRLLGIDVDPGAADNPGVDEFRLITGVTWPLESESIDLAYADYVLEHVNDPDSFFSEVRRVLMPGGYLCMRTTNVRSYVGLAARVVPNRFHARVNSVAQDGRKAEDIFPTRYRCNTRGRIRSQLMRHGFEGIAYGYQAEPSYLSFSALAYAMGVWYQRYMPRRFGPALFVFATKVPD